MYYDIEPKEFTIDEQLPTAEGHVEFHLTAIVKPEDCPECGCEYLYQFGTTKKKVRDLSLFGRQVGLVITCHRYRCKECGKTFTPHLRSIDDSYRMTRRMKEYIRNESLIRPFTSLEDELSISDTTIKRIFGERVKELEKRRELKAPEVLGIDENHIMNGYRAVFTDIKNRLLLDILPKRNKEDVQNWLKALPGKENVRCVTIDMWPQYRDAAYNELPNATVVVDKFHVQKEVNSALDSIRVNLRKDIPEKERKYLKDSR